MLNFICGPSGSGKTSYLIDRIREDIQAQKRCYLLVPEQQAYISERDLPSLLPPRAGLFFEVVNFSRLADDVFREYGGVVQASVNNGLRTLLMWDTLRTLSPLLRQYGKSAKGDPTLTSLMLQTVSELRSNGIDSERLEEIAAQLPSDSALQKKLGDLALVDAVFREKIEGCLGSDPSDKLIRMATALRNHAYFADCNVYLDSFTSFTAQEYEVLGEILRQADSVTVSLCAENLHTSLPQFESTVRTVRRLQKLASDVNTPTSTMILPQNTEKKPPALSLIERNLWRFDVTKGTRPTLSDEEKSCVRLLKCANLYEEAEAAALHILELVTGGMHFGDIAVIVRDVDAWRGVLDAAMEKYGIPYFLSERTDLSSKPLSRLILSALRAVNRHYPAQEIMALVKTGLSGVELSDAAMFEEYCETWHISGSRFTDRLWSMNPDGLTTERSPRAEVILEAANRVRRTVMEPLQRLSAALRLASTMKERCRALYQYLSDVGVSEILAARAKEELANGQQREAGETLRLYRFVTDTLSTLCAVMPDAELSTDEFILSLTILFSETDLGSIPALHDCVMIGSAATMRVENVKAALLLGLCEGEFPASVGDDGILSEGEKTKLEEYGILLDSREQLRSSEELLYVYRAMTKPSQKLFLSTSSAQTDGSARTPSLAFSRVAFLLDVTPTRFDSAAIDALLDLPTLPSKTDTLFIKDIEEKITLYLSQSKLQAFVLCPYRYYSTYQLCLREKMDSRPSYADDGTFLHYVFEQFLRRSLDENGRLNIPAPEEIEPMANEIIDEYLLLVCPLPPSDMDRRLLHLFVRLRRLAVMVLHDIFVELSFSSFVPYRFEQVIGGKDGNGLPPVVLNLKNGSRVSLSGKVDRIDLYDDGEKLYVRVIDYKAGTHKFSVDDVRSGIDVQLVLYLFSVLAANPEKFVAAGAQYLYAANQKGHLGIHRSGFLLDDKQLLAAADRTEGSVYIKKLLLQTQEEINTLGEEMKQAVIGAAERILAGEAQKTPSEDACTFCPVRFHCDRAYHK
ncbi:MAG: PD-(D/E)XK nuclease family protein [Clostridia bacterium]|nr:PD-(D/E)XK nuclease family protein [Clostridia bacterium]